MGRVDMSLRKKEIRLQRQERIIRKRIRIAENWSFNGEVQNRYLKQTHRLAKYNLNCGCVMCHFYKHVGNSAKRYTPKELLVRKEFDKEKY